MRVTRGRFVEIIASALIVPGCAPKDPNAVRIGATSITGNTTIAEIYATSLEQHGISVERHMTFEDGRHAMTALRHGDIDLYPDYVQTRAGAPQSGPLIASSDGALTEALKPFYQTRYGITWLSPSRANDSPCLATSQYAAEEFSLLTLSTCARISPQLRLAATTDFLAAGGALQRLQKVYGGFHFKTIDSFRPGMQYYSLNRGDADVASAFTTAAEIAEGQLIILGDDKHFWPQFSLAPIIRIAAMRAHPKVESILNAVSRTLSQYAVQQLHMRLSLLRMAPHDVAEDFLLTVHPLGAGR